ncbi:MAG: arginine--tRNA ligase, partial [Synechococcales cyanobacterium SupBloom_Metag_052]|nr:arginine--tRNA ligase [Synechococcales cyanobacterium SupBloom_Metag_052]
MLTVFRALEGQLRAATGRAFPEAAAAAEASGKPLDPALGPASKPEFGDFQANGALALAKPLGLPPR